MNNVNTSPTKPSVDTTPAPTAERDRRLLAAIAELKDALRKADAHVGVEKALVRELDHIETQLRGVMNTEFKGALDEVRVQAHLGVIEAQDRFALIEPFMHKVLNAVARAKDRVTDKAKPTAQLQIALAKMEVADFISEQKARARLELEHAEQATETALGQLGDRIVGFRKQVVEGLRKAS